MVQSHTKDRLHDQISIGTTFENQYLVGRYLHTVTHADVYRIHYEENVPDVAPKTGPKLHHHSASNRIRDRSRKHRRQALVNSAKASVLSPAPPYSSIRPGNSKIVSAGTSFSNVYRLRSHISRLHRLERVNNMISLSLLLEFWSADQEGFAGTGFEARVYNMSNLNAHEHSRRSRAIRRLQSRTVLKTKWRHLQVVIYRTDAPKSTGSKEQGTRPTFGKQAQQTKKAKSARQRESQRLRQYDRRRSKASREIRKALHSDLNATVKIAEPETPHTKELTNILDEQSLAVLLLLYYAFEITQKQRKHLPPDTRQVTVKFLESLKFRPTRIRSAQTMQSILDRKDCDLVVLKRLLAKLSSAEYLSEEQLDDHYRQHAKFDCGSEGSRTMQDNSVKPALAQHRIIQSGHRTVGLAIQSVIDAKAAIRKWFSTDPALAKDKIGQIRIGSLYGPHGTLRREDKWRVHSFTDSPGDSRGSQRISRRKRWLLFKEAMEEIQGKELGDMLSFQSSQMQESFRS